MANQFSSIQSNNGGNLKNWYGDSIIGQFNDAIKFYKEVEKGKDSYQGLQVIRALNVSRNQGIGSGSDGGPLPAMGTQGTAQAIITTKQSWLRVGITAGMMKAAQSNKGAFINDVSYQMDRAVIDLKNDHNRQLFWDGSGTIATVAASAVASTVITVTGRDSSEAGNKYVAAGMAIDILDTSGNYKAQSITVNQVTGTSTATLTLASAVTVSATDIVVRAGSYNKEVQGILTSQDGLTTTIYNVDRSLYPIYQGNVVNTAGNQLTLDYMQQTLNEARRLGDGKINVIYCDFDSERFYNKLLVADKRYVGKVVGDGTFTDKDQSYLEFSGSKVVPDKDCFRSFFFIDSKTYKKYVLSELEWATESGSEYIPQSDADSFELRLRLWYNFFPEQPNASARLKGYNSP